MMTCEMLLAVALLAPGQLDKPAEVKQGNVRDGMMAAEPIEVMRSLLLLKFGARPVDALGIGLPYYEMVPADFQQPSSQPYFNYGPATNSVIARADKPAVEGTYLDGYGVVFTVTLPATGRDPRPGATGPKDAPGLSDWDRAQKALHGEWVPEKTTTRKTPAIGDSLLNLLAENGKHFTGLKDDERVTISVIFRGDSPRPAPRFAGPAPPPASAPGSVTIGGTTVSVPAEDKVASFELLGDLHLKQGRPQDAIDSYSKAVAAAEDEWKRVPMLPVDTNFPGERIHGALMKLSQAYLAAGNLDEARKAMDRAAATKERLGRPRKVAHKPAAITPPARLTISAPKKLLDQIGSGKMSLDEFRKQATVEYLSAAP